MTSREDTRVPLPRVLVVEDDENLALLMRYNFERCGYAVDTIDCGGAADAFLTSSRPDLVILDWMLPALSGIEVLRRLRSRGGLGYVPVIMLTARSEREARLRAVGSGVDAFLSKPFSLRELLEQAERLLRPGLHATANRGGCLVTASLRFRPPMPQSLDVASSPENDRSRRATVGRRAWHASGGRKTSITAIAADARPDGHRLRSLRAWLRYRQTAARSARRSFGARFGCLHRAGNGRGARRHRRGGTAHDAAALASALNPHFERFPSRQPKSQTSAINSPRAPSAAPLHADSRRVMASDRDHRSPKA